jgi:Flp pilus assembly pilin Flp
MYAMMRYRDTRRRLAGKEEPDVDALRRLIDVLPSSRGKGQGLVEYALIIVLISVASIFILTTLGGSVSSVFSTINTTMAA